MKTIVLIGTLDTKGPEIGYLRDRLQALGNATLVIDSGILGEPLEITPDIDHAPWRSTGEPPSKRCNRRAAVAGRSTTCAKRSRR